METIPLEMDDIFDDNDIDDVVPSRLPDLDDLDLGLEPMRDSRLDEQTEQQEDNDDITDNPELLAKLKSLKGASKNIQRRTFIKLDATRLTGERGIPVIPKIFKNVKLKGKHHEAEDLKTIMHRLEHWAHRLFPKMSFSEVLERTERLGSKKEVMTCVKRIRLGIPVLATEIEEEEEDVQREGDTAISTTTAATSTIFSSQIPDDDEIDEFLSVEAEINQAASQETESEPREPEPTPKQIDPPTNPTLSEELRAKIEKNKRLAMERRAARLVSMQVASVQTQL